MICFSCKKEIPDDSIFCEHCGTKLVLDEPGYIKCDKCGAIIHDDALFCDYCGFKVEKVKEVVATEPAKEVPSKKKSSKTLVIVLVALVVVAAIGGTYFLKNSSNEDKPNTPDAPVISDTNVNEELSYNGMVFTYSEEYGGYELVGVNDELNIIDGKMLDLNIPDTINDKNVVAISEDAFENISEAVIHNVVIPKHLKVLPIEAFKDICVMAYRVSESNEYYSSENGVLFDKDKDELISYIYTEESNRYIVPDSVRVIRSGAFNWLSEASMVFVPKTVTEIQTNAFLFSHNTAYHLYFENGLDDFAWPDHYGFENENRIFARWETGKELFNRIPDIKPEDFLEKEKCTIGFDANGGSGTMSEITIVKGASTLLPLCKFERKGYMFEYWSIYPSTQRIPTYYTVTSDMTLMANWWKDPSYSEDTYTIRFDSGEGSGIMSEIVVKKGESVVLPKCTLSKYGYSFSHWTEYPMDRFVANDGAVYTPTKSITLKAKWVVPKYYEVTLKSGDERNAVTSRRVDMNKTFVLTERVLEGKGRTVVGWIDKENNIKYDYEINKCFNQNVTLYAIWKDETLTDQSGSIGTNVTFSFSASTKVLTISGSGEMSDHEYNKAPWADYKEYIEGIVVEEGVTKLGSNAFYGCSAAKYITLPNSLKVIEFNAFRACSSLKTITIPKNVERIWGSGQTFADDNLEEIIVAEGNKRYESVDGVLYDKIDHVLKSYPAAKKGSTYSIPNTTVKVYGMAFSNAQYLESITIPKSVTFIDGNSLVHRCKKLGTVYYEGTTSEYEAIEKYIGPSGGTTLPDTVKLVCLGD